jgi:hypothetical protein
MEPDGEKRFSRRTMFMTKYKKENARAAGLQGMSGVLLNDYKSTSAEFRFPATPGKNF